MAASMPEQTPGPEQAGGEFVELSREAIQGANDRQLVPLQIPEWKGTIYLRPLTGKEKADYWDSLLVESNGERTFDKANERAKLAVLCCCNSQGAQLFCDHDVSWLSEKCSAALERIYQKADAMSLISATALEGLRKN